MTIQDLKDQNLIVLECISGSRAYGTDVPGSDTDIRGVFVLPKDRFYGMSYVPQVSDTTNDTVYYELGRFVELASKNNPNILELLAMPEAQTLLRHPVMDRFPVELFLSRRCKHTFGGYAIAQIKKARGLNKKIVNPVGKDLKPLLDFCYVFQHQGSISLQQWLDRKGLRQQQLGLVNVPHAEGVFGIYVDQNDEGLYKGVQRKPDATTVLLSSVEKGVAPAGYLYFNLDGYKQYRRQYREYWTWMEERNEERYANNQRHGRNYDSKNMMHTFRLLDMGTEILRDGKVIVRRPNRDELMAIRRGDFEYELLIERAETKMQEMDELATTSPLPKQPDLARIEAALVRARLEWYG